MNKQLIIMVVFMLLLICGQSVLATNTIPEIENPYNDDMVDSKLSSVADKVWNSVVNIVRILSLGCVVFAGIRYMFASADQRADIKNSLIYLAIGAILVFGGFEVINFVVRVFNETTAK